MEIGFDIKKQRPEVKFELDNLRVAQGGSGNVSSEQIDVIVVLDRGEYEALAVKDPRTVYLIRG